MQVSSLKTVLKTAVSRQFVRTVAANTQSLEATEDTQNLKSWQEIPGPSSWPIIGQIHHFVLGGKFSNVNDFQKNLYLAFGPIARLDAMIGRPPMLFLYDPDSTAQILRGENRMPVRPGFDSLAYYRKYYKKTKEQSLKPTGLITDHHDNWREVRSVVNPVMMQPKTIKLYKGVLAEVADDMVNRLRSLRCADYRIKEDFFEEMNLWALESIGVVALGGRLNCFDPNLKEDSPERRLIQCIHDVFIVSNQLDFEPSIWRYYATKKFKSAMKLYEEHENLTKFFVKKAMKELQSKNKSEKDKMGVLEKLLEINEEIAVIMACDMLFAGVDTAATSITTTLYLLANNIDKQDKLRAEIMSGDESKRYLKACLKESLRIYPVVGGNMRETTKEYNILGYRIPKGMQIVLNHQYMSLMESQFPRPQEFIPERWIDKDSPLYYDSAHPFSYSPFGFGVRMCIGRRIAELEMETILEKVIKNFRLEWNGPPPKITVTSLNYVEGPFHFIFKDV